MTKARIWGGVGFILVGALMAYYAFVTAKCLHYPWWVGQGSDGDGTYVTQTLALMNNGDYTLVFHPGATVYSIHGMVYRFLALFFAPYQSFVQLGQVPTPAAAFEILDLAMRTSRVVTYLLNLACLLLFWKVLHLLSQRKTLSFLLAAYVMTTNFMLNERVFIIRPELTSFIFLILLFIVVMKANDSQSNALPLGSVWALVAGFVAGLAVFAKIQALPIALCMILFWVFSKSKVLAGAPPHRLALISLIAAAGNFVIFPWSWLERPAILTSEYLRRISPNVDLTGIYGPVPQTLAPTFVSVFVGLLILTLVFGLNKQLCKFVAIIYKFNLLVTGLIVSCYVVFLPLGMSYTAYMANSNHLLYSMLTNVFYGGTMNHRIIDSTLFQYIYMLHGSSRILGIHIFDLIFVASAVAVLRIWFGRRGRKRPYCLALLFFTIAFLMDMLSSFRRYAPDAAIVSSYAIYSLPLHACGLAVWVAAECELWSQRRLRVGPYAIVCAFLMLHLVFVARNLMRLPKASGVVTFQTPEGEMLNTMSQVGPFWTIASGGQIK